MMRLPGVCPTATRLARIMPANPCSTLLPHLRRLSMVEGAGCAVRDAWCKGIELSH